MHVVLPSQESTNHNAHGHAHGLGHTTHTHTARARAAHLSLCIASLWHRRDTRFVTPLGSPERYYGPWPRTYLFITILSTRSTMYHPFYRALTERLEALLCSPDRKAVYPRTDAPVANGLSLRSPSQRIAHELISCACPSGGVRRPLCAQCWGHTRVNGICWPGLAWWQWPWRLIFGRTASYGLPKACSARRRCARTPGIRTARELLPCGHP